jgi:TIR domain/Leucine rich repeat
MAPNSRFQLFLSHNSADKPAVEALAGRLRAAGIEPWLDVWHLIPGDPWQPAAVCVGPGGLGPWQHEEMRVAIGRRVDTGRGAGPADRFRVIPVLLPGAERPQRSSLPPFLTQTTWVEFRRSLDEQEPLRRLVCGARGVEPGAAPGEGVVEGECPYRGLEYFDVGHAKYFFGREALTEWLLTALRRSPAGGENRFLAIVGASGSGKSSLARAGLVAAVKRGELDGSADWPVMICRPGADPVEALAVALAGLGGGGANAAAVQGLMAALRASENTLHLTARLALRDTSPGRRALLLVDQFEEVFTLCPDEGARKAVIDNLVYAGTVAGGQAVVVLTVRADFVGRCASYAALAAALSDRQALVGPMTEDELRRAIERPAYLAGCEPVPGLVDVLFQDVQGQPGALPLLQFALRELWDRRDGRRLTLEAYRQMGELRGALDKRATDILKGFTDAEREVCRRVFLRLTQPGEGTEDTKRRASYQELVSAAAEPGVVDKVVGKLADARLVTTEGGGGGSVEVAHEALIRNWSELRKWVEADRAGLRTHRRLTEAAAEWQANGRDPSFLYAGARLAVANEWAAHRGPDMSPVEVDFLAASRDAQRGREQQELEAERGKREAAERTARGERQRRRLWMGLAVAVLAGMALGAVVVVPALVDRYHKRRVEAWLNWARKEHGLTDASWSQTQSGRYRVVLNGPLTGDGGGARDPDDKDGLGDEAVQAILDRAIEDGLAERIGGLDLSRCGLTRVPHNIDRFRNLRVLNLSWNHRLTDVPAQIGELGELIELDLGQSGGLTGLPAEIGRLKKLKKLHAPRAGLTTLPAEVGGLESLVSLHLSNNPLRTLPPEIGKLSGLVELYLEGTELSDLPDAITGLHYLKTLRVGNNQHLAALPNTVLALPRLEVISIPEHLKKTPLADSLRAKGVVVQSGGGGGKGTGGGGGGGGGSGSGGGGKGTGGGGGKGVRGGPPDRDGDR